MTSYVPPKKNFASGYIFYVSLAPRTATGTWQANPTLASGDVQIAIDDGDPANLATLPAVDANFTKRVKVVLSQAETNGDNLSIIFSDASGAEWCDLTVNLQTAAQTLDEMDTVIDSILADTAEIGAAGAGLTEAGGTGDHLTALATQASVDTIDGIVDAILLDTAVIGALGAGLTAIPWNSAWDAEVQSEVADALAVYDPPTNTEMTSAFTEIKGATWATTDTLEAIRDRGDAAWITATGFSTHAAADVWSVGTRLLTAGTNIVLAKGTGVTGFNDLSAAQVNAEADTALADYDPPTKAELDAGLAALNDIAVADILTTQMTEAYAADGVAPTLAQALFLIQQTLGDFSITGTTLTVRKLDGSTTAASFTLNDATSPTAITRAS